MIRRTVLMAAMAVAAWPQAKPPVKPAAPKPAVKAKAATPKPVSAPKPGSTPVPSAIDIPKLPEARVTHVSAASTARQPSADLTLGLKPPAPREFAPLATHQFTLANGMQVILHEDPRIPWIAGNLRIGAGTVLDPPLKAGLAEMLLRTIRSGGPRNSTRAAHQEKIESLGAVWQADAGDGTSSLVFRSVSGALDEVLALAASSVIDPSFDEDALEESRAQIRNRIGARNNSLELIVTRESRDAVLGGLAPPRPEFSTLANSGQEDLRLFHRQHYSPATSALILSGDFSATAIRPRIEALFGGWKAPPLVAKTEAPGLPAPAGVQFAETVRAQAAGFAMARTGPALGSPESAGAAVLAELLSGGTSSRLAQLAQSKPSWTLKTVSTLETSPGRPTIFTIRGLCDTPYPVDAMLGIVDDAASIRRGEVTDAAIDAARRAAMSAWIAQFPNPLSRLTFDESARRAGLSPDFTAAHFKALAAVRKADVARAAQTLLDPKTLHVTVAANSTLMNRPLAEFREPVKTIDLTIPVARPLEAKASPEAIERGKAWLAKVRVAVGGAEKLAAVKDLEIVSKGTHLNSTIQLTDRWLAPGTLRQDQETQPGVTSVFYNGEIGWIGSVGRVSALSQAMLLQVRGELLRVLPLLVASDLDPARTVSHAGSNVLLITGANGTAVRVFIDEATDLPARLVYQSINAAGLPAMAEETWSEWTESGGIKFPGKIVLRMDGRRAGEMTVTSIKVNSGLKVADIERKP